MQAPQPQRPSAFQRLTKAPKRISVTVPGSLFARLEICSVQQGRSISNLCAFLLESACDQLGM
jgi:hypothetical protein